MDEISLTCVNDCMELDVPIVKFNMSAIKATSQGYGNGRQSSFQTNLSADYFNKRIADWEPMLEPWNFRAQVYQNNALYGQ